MRSSTRGTSAQKTVRIVDVRLHQGLKCSVPRPQYPRVRPAGDCLVDAGFSPVLYPSELPDWTSGIIHTRLSSVSFAAGIQEGLASRCSPPTPHSYPSVCWLTGVFPWGTVSWSRAVVEAESEQAWRLEWQSPQGTTLGWTQPDALM